MEKTEYNKEKSKVLDFLIEYSKLLAFVTFVFFLGIWTQNANNRMFDDLKQKTDLIQQIENPDTHFTTKQLNNEFVGRQEFIMTMQATNLNLEKINKNLENIQQLQMIK